MVADLGALTDEPPSLGEALAGFAVLGFDDAAASRTYLARVEGTPMAASLGLVLGDVLGISNVATIEDARRRDIGRAVTLAALRDGAARGAHVAAPKSSTEATPRTNARAFATTRITG
jgi:hypothetical protein